MYGFTNTDNMHGLAMPLLERVVMQKRIADDPQLYWDASPIHRVHEDARRSSFYGENDSIVPRHRRRRSVPP